MAEIKRNKHVQLFNAKKFVFCIEKKSLFRFSAFSLYTIMMKIVFLLLVVAAIIYLIFRLLATLLAAISGKPAFPNTPVVLQPARPELDISTADQGKDGMPGHHQQISWRYTQHPVSKTGCRSVRGFSRKTGG